MAGSAPGQITELLVAWRNGEDSALDRLIPMVYGELRRLARLYMAAERNGHTLQTTALVNEAYVRLVDSKRVRWRDRAHFFALSAKLMRRVLVDSARSRNAQKRGAELRRVSFDAALRLAPAYDTDLVQMDEALDALANVYPRKARVIELRFFGGLGLEEAAEVLGVSSDTVLRDWNFARVWLRRELMRGVRGAH